MLLTTAAVLLLSSSGKRLEGRFILLGLLACVCYCLSDLCIKVLVDHFLFLGVLRGAVMATAVGSRHGSVVFKRRLAPRKYPHRSP